MVSTRPDSPDGLGTLQVVTYFSCRMRLSYKAASSPPRSGRIRALWWSPKVLNATGFLPIQCRGKDAASQLSQFFKSNPPGHSRVVGVQARTAYPNCRRGVWRWIDRAGAGFPFQQSFSGRRRSRDAEIGGLFSGCASSDRLFNGSSALCRSSWQRCVSSDPYPRV